MSKKYHSKKIWRDLRMQERANYIELIEHKPYETFSVVLFESILIALLTLLVGVLYPSVDLVGILILSVFFIIPMLVGLWRYRPPRWLRVYPEEGLLAVGRRTFWINRTLRWQDISQGDEEVFNMLVKEVPQYKTRPTGLTTGISRVLVFSGPVGWILSFVIGAIQGWKTEDQWCYGLVLEERTDKPIAIFVELEEVARVVAVMRTACFDSTSDG